MDTDFSSINDRSFWKADLFCGKNDMGSYENSVYPCIFPAVSHRAGDGWISVYCTADSVGCGNHHLVCKNCILKETVISIWVWRFLLTMGNTQSIMKKNQLSMDSRRGVPGEAAFSLQHSIPIKKMKKASRKGEIPL